MTDWLSEAARLQAEKETLQTEIERLYMEKEALIQRLENCKIRAEYAEGRTYEEMRKNLSPELWRQGDVRLVWVNEGDYILFKMGVK
jgi:hypothetical protein